MDNSQRARIARYAQVRKAKELSRHDDSLLSFNQRMFRTILSKSLEIIEWNHEVEQDGIPLWFDAYVMVNLERGKKRACMVDRQPPTGYSDKYSKLQRERKQTYCTTLSIPYLIAPHSRMQAELMIFKLKVQRGEL